MTGVQIQLRRDTAANWSATNPVLASGEMGLDLTNNIIRIGDGVTAWNSLGVWLAPALSWQAKTAFVATQENTASTSYADLPTTTDQVTVNVGISGMVMVFLFGAILQNTSGGLVYMSFALSGANIQAANDNMAVQYMAYATGTAQTALGAPFLLTGLAAGATTFKCKYRVNAGTGYFQYRRIAVIPL